MVCHACHRQPKDLHTVAKSIVLSGECLGDGALSKMQNVVQRGVDWTLSPSAQQLLQEWRSRLSDGKGELDLMKIVHYSQMRASLKDIAKKQADSGPPNDVIDLGLNTHEDQDKVQQSQPSQEWADWLKTVFSVLAFFAPTLGLFIGTFGMALRDNRRQCKSVWIASVIGFVLFGGYCCLGNAIVRNSLVSGLIVAGILGLGLLWTLTIYLSTRKNMNAKLSAVVIAALILIGTFWLGASLSLSDDIWKTKDQGRSTAASPAAPTKYTRIPAPLFTPMVAPIAVASPSVTPVPTLDIQYSLLGAYRRKVVVPYFNDFMPAAARLELVAIDRWVQILKSNTSVADAAVITEREIIPNWRNYMDFLQKNYPDGEDRR